MKGVKKTAIVLGLLLGFSSLTGCGKQSHDVIQHSEVSKVELSAAGGSVDVSLVSGLVPSDYGLQKESDGFCISVESGKVTGEVISELEYNNLMATYYNTDGYSTVSVNDLEGFAYTSEPVTSQSEIGSDIDSNTEPDTETASSPDDQESVTIEEMNEQPKDVANVSDGMRYHVFCIDDANGLFVKLSSVAGDDALYQAEDVLTFSVTSNAKSGSDSSTDVIDNTDSGSDADFEEKQE